MFRTMGRRSGGPVDTEVVIQPRAFPRQLELDCIERFVWDQLSRAGLRALFEGVFYPVAISDSEVLQACNPDFTILDETGRPLLNIECTKAGNRKYCRHGQTMSKMRETVSRKDLQHDLIVERFGILTIQVTWELYLKLRRHPNKFLDLIEATIGPIVIAA